MYSPALALWLVVAGLTADPIIRTHFELHAANQMLVKLPEDLVTLKNRALALNAAQTRSLIELRTATGLTGGQHLVANKHLQAARAQLMLVLKLSAQGFAPSAQCLRSLDAAGLRLREGDAAGAAALLERDVRTPLRLTASTLANCNKALTEAEQALTAAQAVIKK